MPKSVPVLRISRAHAMPGRDVPSIAIVIDDEIPDLGSIALHENHYRSQARALADALEGSLPGGSLCELTAELLIRKASKLRVTR